jgi:hypothetical protein
MGFASQLSLHLFHSGARMDLGSGDLQDRVSQGDMHDVADKEPGILSLNGDFAQLGDILDNRECD